MKFRIHYTLPADPRLSLSAHENSVVVSGETIDEIREAATREVEKRGGVDQWSEEL